MFALVAQQRYIPERGPGHQAGSGKAAPSAGRTRAGGPGGKQTRVQELDELHVLLQQHILVKDAPHRVLAEHAVLRSRQKKKKRKKQSEKMKTSGEDRACPRSLALRPTHLLLAQLTRRSRLVEGTPSPQKLHQRPQQPTLQNRHKTPW